MNGSQSSPSQRLTNLALTGVAAIGLYLTAAALYDGPRVSTSTWLALRRPLNAPATRWVSASLYVPQSYDDLPNAAPWRKNIASLTARGHQGLAGCWRVRLIIDTARRQTERSWLLRGPTCEPDPGAPPPIRIPPGLAPE